MSLIMTFRTLPVLSTVVALTTCLIWLLYVKVLFIPSVMLTKHTSPTCACDNSRKCNHINTNNTEQTDRETSNDYPVPNIVHYIWYKDKNEEMRFDQAISVMSAAKNIQPEVIYFHTNRPPHGKYFNMLIKLPNFKITQRQPPVSAFKKAVPGIIHADYDRVKILLEYGGIYLDLDVMVIQSFDDLRKYRCTMGIEHDQVLNAGVIVCERNHPFLHIWLNSFYDDFSVSWAYNSGQVSSKLAIRYPHLIHIESKRLHHPNWQMMDSIWGETPFPWTENYCIHTWIRMLPGKKYPTENSIKRDNSTYAQIAKSVY